MRKRDNVIELKGIVRNTKDSATADGECDELIGMRFKDGSWRPVGSLKKVQGSEFVMAQRPQRMWVHRNKYAHVLFINASGMLCWGGDMKEEGKMQPLYPSMIISEGPYGHPESMVLTQTGHLITLKSEEKGVQYFMFRMENGKYDEVAADFNSVRDFGLLPYGTIDFKVERVEDEDGRPVWFGSDLQQAGIKDASGNIERESEVMKTVVDKTSGLLKKLGLFNGAFLVCTAAELYDGTYILMSRPTLLCPPNYATRDAMGNFGAQLRKYPNATGENKGNGSYEWEGADGVCDLFVYTQGTLPEGNTVMNDVRRGQLGILPWMYSNRGGGSFNNSPLTGYFLDARRSMRPYVYDKELVFGENFSAYSFDTWSILNPHDVNFQADPRNAFGGFITCAAKNLRPFCQMQCYADMGYDNISCFTNANKLYYKVNNLLSREYKDVIKNISVFVTREVEMFDYANAPMTDRYGESTIIKSYQWGFRDNDKVEKELMAEPLMYKIGEISVDLAEADRNKWVELTIEPGVLENLVSQERLKVDSVGRNSFKPNVAFPYNGRLHIANYEERLFEGWLLQDMFHWGGKGQYGYTKKYLSGWGRSRSLDKGYVKVTLEDSEAKRVVVREIQLKYIAGGLKAAGKPGGAVPMFGPASVQSLGCMLSYPDKRAKEIEICLVDSSVPSGNNNTFYLKVPLTAHDWYNMAYYVNDDFKPIEIVYTETRNSLVIPQEENVSEMRLNRMKVSAVDNPLFFPNEQVYSIGNGEIRGLATNAETLVGGQLGDAPLYVMCSDGTYGMFVDSSGQFAYSNSRIISRYVCNNPLGIKAINGGVVMPTEWGLVLLRGLDSADVSDKIEGKPFDIENSINGAWKCIGHERLVEVQDLCFPKNFVEWLKDAQIAYNFYDKELWVTVTGSAAAEEGGCLSYVLGDDGYWTKRREHGVFVEDFPNIYMLKRELWNNADGGEMVDLQREDFSEATEVMFMSRMVKAGTQEFKQTERLIVRGDFKLPEHHEIARRIDISGESAKPDFVNVTAENPEVTTLYEGDGLQRISGEVLYAKTFAVVEVTGEFDLAEETGLNWSNGNSLKEGLNGKSEMWDGTLRKQTWTRLEGVSEHVPEFRFDEAGDVCVRFGGKTPYFAGIGLNSTEGYLDTVMMFPAGWEGKYSTLVDIVRGETGDSRVIFKRGTLNGGILEYTWGTTQPSSQDQVGVLIEYDNNYKVILTSGTTVKHQQVITAWLAENDVAATTGCYDLAMAMLGKSGDWEAEKRNNEVELAAGNVAGDDGLLFSVTQAQAGTYLYYEIEENVASGVFGRPQSYIGIYKLYNGMYYRLGNSGDVFECSEGGRYTWSELRRKVDEGEFKMVEIVDDSETVQLNTFEAYWFRFSNVTNVSDINSKVIYLGVPGERSISWIASNINNTNIFSPIPSEGTVSYSFLAISFLSLTLEVGKVVSVNIESPDAWKRVMITSDDPEERYVTKSLAGWSEYFEEAEEYEGGEAPKAGLYLWGSYDGKKWALLGARERDGEFRDLGLESHRVDCKYFRLQFCGKLMEGSSIEYIEQEVKERLFEGKVR